MCSKCHAFLPEPHQPGARLCFDCQPKHRVFMSFTRVGDGWRLLFKDHQTSWPLSRVVTFRDPDKIRNLYQRFGSKRMSEDVAAFEYGLQQGSGIVELTLGDDQYRVLQTAKAPPRRVRP